jgi:hypothetical protein
MASSPLPWGPREGKALCVIDFDLARDIDCSQHRLEDILRMCIDFCLWSVRNQRRNMDPQPPPPKSLADFKTFQELGTYMQRQHDEAQKNPWITIIEVIPPTTLFTDPTNPGVRINLSLPPGLTAEIRNQFGQKWGELMADVRQSGVGPFLDLYRKPSGVFGGGPPVKADYPLNRWGPLHVSGGLICTKNPQRRIIP